MTLLVCPLVGRSGQTLWRLGIERNPGKKDAFGTC
jgi:hypothetical protein